MRDLDRHLGWSAGRFHGYPHLLTIPGAPRLLTWPGFLRSARFAITYEIMLNIPPPRLGRFREADLDVFLGACTHEIAQMGSDLGSRGAALRSVIGVTVETVSGELRHVRLYDAI